MNKTTGIGSLPFTNLEKAIDFSLNLDLPFVPELTKMGDSLLKRDSSILLQMAERCIAKKLKNQIIGPATFQKLSGQNFYEYTKYFKKNLELNRDIKEKYQLEFFLQIDEPILLSSSEDKIFYRDLLLAIKDENIFPILHSCQKFESDFLFPHWEIPYLALDVQLNPQYVLHPQLFIEGYDPRLNTRGGNSEYVSFTCGFGLMSDWETEKIQKKFKP